MSNRVVAAGVSVHAHRVELFQPELCSDHDWARCYALRCTEHREQGTQARSLAAYRAWHFPTLGGQRDHWVARHGDAIIGKMELAPVRANAAALLNLYVSPEARRRGIARAFLREALAVTRKRGIAVLYISVRQAQGWQLCERFGGLLESAATQRLLSLADVPWDTVHAWCEAGAARSLGTWLEEFERLPEARAHAFFELYARVAADLPASALHVSDRTLASRRERERCYERQHCRWITLVAYRSPAVLSGLTEVLYDPQDPELVHQLFTCVSPEQRGRGLAQWLKAAMLRSIRARFPTALRIQTSNSDENAAMLAINRRLGFGAALCDRTYQFDVAALARRLGWDASGSRTGSAYDLP